MAVATPITDMDITATRWTGGSGAAIATSGQAVGPTPAPFQSANGTGAGSGGLQYTHIVAAVVAVAFGTLILLHRGGFRIVTDVGVTGG